MKNQLKSEIQSMGMLFLNVNRYFPSVCGLGGDWDTIMSLIEDREVFFSKLYKNRTTYLSKEMYFYLKRFKQRGRLSETEQKICNFLDESNGADSEIIKSCLLLSDKAFDIAMNRLLRDLHVTVLSRGKRLNEQWTTLVWGTYRQWEEDCSMSECCLSDVQCRDEIIKILSKNLTTSEINKILE